MVPDRALEPADYCAVDFPNIRNGQELTMVPYYGPAAKADLVLPASNPSDAKLMFEAWSLANESEAGKIGTIKAIPGFGEKYVLEIQSATNEYQEGMAKIASEYRRKKKYDANLVNQIILRKGELFKRLEYISPSLQGFVSVPDGAIEEYQTELNEIKTKKSSKSRRAGLRRLAKQVSQDARLESQEILNVSPRTLKYLRNTNKFMVAVEFAPLLGTVLTAQNEDERKKAFKQMAAKGAGEAASTVSTAAGMKLCVFFGGVTGGVGFIGCALVAVGAGVYIGIRTEQYASKQIIKETPDNVLP